MPAITQVCCVLLDGYDYYGVNQTFYLTYIGQYACVCIPAIDDYSVEYTEYFSIYLDFEHPQVASEYDSTSVAIGDNDGMYVILCM